MKKLIAVLIVVAFSACMKDDVRETYVIYRPQYEKKSVVLSNIKSAAPTVLHNPGKLFIRDKIAYVNEVNEGVHMIDYSNPGSPINKYFIRIPGNVDIAVKDHYLYADCYTYLVVIDIADPNNAKPVKFMPNAFPNRFLTPFAPSDTTMMIVGWTQKDTIINRTLTEAELRNPTWGGGVLFTAQSSSAPSSKSTSTGTAGSMSRFALMNDRLYAVTNSDIKVFNTSNSADPVFVKDVSGFGNDLETIFPFADKLFIGSSTGMRIFSVSDPDLPKYISGFAHARGCDPVVTDGEHAYVTIRSGSVCGGVLNQMDVLNVKNLPTVQLIKSYPFSNPQGLSKAGNLVFLCDGKGGLRVLDAANVSNITQLSQLKSFDAFDVIAENNLAIVTAKGALIFIDYSDPLKPVIKSTVTIN